jgi:geranylgeranyl diphosphate synthase type II
VKALLIVLGFKSNADAIQDFTFKAFQMLDQMNISDDKKAMLKAFGENLMGRKV